MKPQLREELRALFAKLANWSNTLIYILGLLLYALGVNLLVKAELGVSPLSSLAYVIACITGLRLSVTLFGFNLVVLLVQRLTLGKQFEQTQYLQILANLMFSVCVDATLPLAALFSPATLFSRGMLLAAGMAALALGVTLVKEADILMLSGDGIGRVIHLKTGMHFGTAKMLNDCLTGGAAAAVSLIFLGDIIGIQGGTIIAAVGVGVMAKHLGILLQSHIRTFTACGVSESP